MATYAALSEPDKAVVQNTVNLVRSAAGSVAKTWNQMKAIADDANAVALITSIDAGDTIPNTSGLSGADELTRNEVVALYTLLNLIHTTNDTTNNRAAMSKAAGINAMLG